MSQQINLYEERLRPCCELATGRHLAVALGVVLATVVLAGVYARIQAERISARFSTVQVELSAVQAQVSALTKVLAERRVSSALQTEIDNAKTLLSARTEVAGALDSGGIGNTTGFSEIMGGFARQATGDLWLTGFLVSAGGQNIEIRGRLLDSTRLPPYVQRLSAEPAFQGRRFAALDVQSVEPEEGKGEAVGAVRPDTVAVPQTQTPRLPRYLEFILRSENSGEKK